MTPEQIKDALAPDLITVAARLVDGPYTYLGAARFLADMLHSIGEYGPLCASAVKLGDATYVPCFDPDYQHTWRGPDRLLIQTGEMELASLALVRVGLKRMKAPELEYLVNALVWASADKKRESGLADDAAAFLIVLREEDRRMREIGF
jgi:hypothetical protein